jgi:uncharacterized protein (TIGR02757 family)
VSRTRHPDPATREILEEGYDRFCRSSFIEDDPISIPHLFTHRPDVEVAGLFAATLAWGQRPTILRNAHSLMQRMDMAPHSYVLHASASDLESLSGFVHRTFMAQDAKWFVLALRRIYAEKDSLEDVFIDGMEGQTDTAQAISRFRALMLREPHDRRSVKHVADPMAGSAAKRINMFLRWMVRNDGRGVDLGIWNRIPTSRLSCPLDVHSGRTARQLGLLHRTADDQKAVQELDVALRIYDPIDPVKYDFALFGLSMAAPALPRPV